MSDTAVDFAARYRQAFEALAVAHAAEHAAVETLHAAQAVTEHADRACRTAAAELLASARGDIELPS